MKKKVYFRADAGQSIGYGHFIRSLALADMLKDDFDCTFFTQTPTEYQKQEAEKVCPLVALPADDTKFGLFLDQLMGDEIVVLDNYFFTSEYQLQIKQKGCKLVCIDDMHDKHFYADVVVNHGFANSIDYDIESYCRLCIGNNWSLIREPFLNAWKDKNYTKCHSHGISEVAVCFGGSDSLGLTDVAIELLTNILQIKKINVIVGNHYQIKKEYPSIVNFYQNVSAQEVASIFLSSDLAVVSLSSVCIEAMACGTLVAAGWYVENQRIGYQATVEHRLIYGLGKLPEGLSKLNTLIMNINLSSNLERLNTKNIKRDYLKLFSNI